MSNYFICQEKSHIQPVAKRDDNGQNCCFGPTTCEKKRELNMVCTDPMEMKITATRTCANDDGPVGRITRHQDFDLIGSKYVYTCICGRRNGLQEDCKRISCQNNPGCKMNPPKCWPKYKPPPAQKYEMNGLVRICHTVDKKY